MITEKREIVDVQASSVSVLKLFFLHNDNKKREWKKLGKMEIFKKKRVLVFEFHQESNSFCPVNSIMEDYTRCSVLEGKDFLKGVMGCQLAPCGMFDVLQEEEIEILPGYAMRAPSGGIVEHGVVEHFLKKMQEYLERCLPVDGILVSMHGATQSTREDDVCGLILKKLRDQTGSDTVIAASLDLHANVTERMYDNADFLCGYLTYPHVDVYETGARAARLAVRAMKERRTMHMARSLVPMIVPACGYSTGEEPLRSLGKRARQLVENGELEDYTIFHMQPWLDVKEGSGAVLCIGKNEKETEAYADMLAKEVFALREQMQPQLDEVDDVICIAEKLHTGKPVIMVDFADSPNAGAAGDSVYVLERILSLQSSVKAAYVITDLPAVEAAFKAGVGAKIDIALGGTRGSVNVKPILVHAQVCSLHDGEFLLEGPSMRGVAAHIGKTATLRVGNVDIVACESMASPGDPQLYRHFGVEPSFYQLVVVKACTSYRAAYEVLAEKICVVDTKGAATADIESLPFQKLSKDIYPFNKEATIDCFVKNNRNTE